MPQFEKRSHRARNALIQAGRDYPSVWKDADHFRQQKGEPGFDWPDWCFLPLGAAYAVVSGGGPNRVSLERADDVPRLGALMAWRMTQGIYRFDPAIYDAVIDTPMAGDLPAEVVMRMPEWCVYIETPEIELSIGALHGFWAHLEYDFSGCRTELRLLLDTDRASVAIPLHLGAWSLAESIARAVDVAGVKAVALGVRLPAGAARQARSWAAPLVSLLLYLCHTNDFSRRGTQGQPANPKPVRTRRDGVKLFAADGPAEWDVGVRMGAALRAAYQAEQATDAGGTHAGPRGHIRHAHWHGFRSGPKARDDGSEIPTAQRRYDLRWMPPIPVNLPDGTALPATIRSIR